MSSTHVKRLIWLTSFMARHPNGVIMKELDRAWVNSGLGNGANYMPRQTLYNLIEGVGIAFGISIINDKEINKWRIENPECLEDNQFKNWLIETFSIASLLKDYSSIQKYILFDNDQQFKANLELMMESISEGKTVKFQYTSPDKDKCQQIELLPYFIEQYNHKWFVVGKIDDDCYHKLSELGTMLAQQHNRPELSRWLGSPDALKIIAISNISDVEITDNSYQIPPDFDPKALKEEIAGPLLHEYLGTDGKHHKTIADKLKMDVVIKAKGFAKAKISQSPLCQNQELIEEFEGETPEDSYKVFKCNVIPSSMFLRDLMKFGDCVEILHPESVKEKMREIIEKTLENYKN